MFYRLSLMVSFVKGRPVFFNKESDFMPQLQEIHVTCSPNSRMEEGRDINGKTCLHLAEKGYVGVVEMLIEELIKQRKGAAVNTKDNNGRTPLHRAVKKDCLAVVQLLIKNVANVNAESRKDEWFRFYRATQKDHLAVMELLIQNGADVNAQDKDQNTPLYLAAESCDQAVMELLIQNGADVNAKNNRGWPPLFQVTIGNHQAIMELLINNGADINAEIGEFKWTLLHHAAHDGCLERTKFFVEKGANIKLKEACRNTPLDLANICLRRSTDRDRLREFKNRVNKLSNRGPGEPPILGRHQEVISFLRLAAKNSHNDKNNNESAETSFRCNIF